MKSATFGAPALAGAIGLALTAGDAMADPPPAGPANGPYDWSGVYVGLNTGWTSFHSHADASTLTINQLSGVNNGTSTVTVPATTVTSKPQGLTTSSWTGGGQVGFQKQLGHLVLGVEGDMDAVGGHSSGASSYALPATALTTGSTVSVDRFVNPQWDGSLRGRLGLALGRALIYGTGGLAVADVHDATLYGYAPTVTSAVTAANPSTTFGPYAGYASNHSTLTGWTVGAGGEVALNRAVSVGLEYRYSDYGHATYGFETDAPNSVSEAPRIGLIDNQVLAKINFRFGPGGF